MRCEKKNFMKFPSALFFNAIPSLCVMTQIKLHNDMYNMTNAEINLYSFIPIEPYQ